MNFEGFRKERENEGFQRVACDGILKCHETFFKFSKLKVENRNKLKIKNFKSQKNSYKKFIEK